MMVVCGRPRYGDIPPMLFHALNQIHGYSAAKRAVTFWSPPPKIHDIEKVCWGVPK